MTDSEMLKQKIIDSGFRIDYLCTKLGMSYATLRRKINNESEFLASEISSLTDLLDLTDTERDQIFFASKVI